MVTEIKLEEFDRKDSFLKFFYKKRPFVSITTELDITNFVKYSKKHKNLYALMGFAISQCVSEVKEFRYRFENGKIVLYSNVSTSFTDLKKDKNVGFLTVPYSNNYSDFLSNFKIEREKMLEESIVPSEDEGQIWCSCVPWYKFSSVEVPYDEDYTIPQFIWGQFEKKKRKYYVNMHIFANHGFVDGYHIGLFIEKFNEIQKNIKEYV